MRNLPVTPRQTVVLGLLDKMESKPPPPAPKMLKMRKIHITSLPPTADILACHSMKSTGVVNNINTHLGAPVQAYWDMYI